MEVYNTNTTTGYELDYNDNIDEDVFELMLAECDSNHSYTLCAYEIHECIIKW